MTDERKQAEEDRLLIEAKQRVAGEMYRLWNGMMIEFEEGNGGISVEELVNRVAKAYASLKVAEATKEMYPLDFVIWKDRKELTYSSMSGRYYSETETGVKEFTLYELFEYWKQNISK